MNTERTRGECNNQKWLHIIREVAKSELTISEWCRRNKVSINTYYAARARLIKRNLINAADLRPAAPVDQITEPGAFVKVDSLIVEHSVQVLDGTEEKPNTDIILETGPFRIHIPDGFTKGTLQSILDVLRTQV